LVGLLVVGWDLTALLTQTRSYHACKLIDTFQIMQMMSRTDALSKSRVESLGEERVWKTAEEHFD